MSETLRAIIERGNITKDATANRLLGLKGIASMLESSGHPASAQRIMSPMNQVFLGWQKFVLHHEQHTLCVDGECSKEALGFIQTMESLEDMKYEEAILAELVEEERLLRCSIDGLILSAEALLEDKKLSADVKHWYDEIDLLRSKSVPERSGSFSALERIQAQLEEMLLHIKALP